MQNDLNLFIILQNNSIMVNQSNKYFNYTIFINYIIF